MIRSIRSLALALVGTAACLLPGAKASAQALSTYEFSQFTDTYQEFQGDSGINNGGANDDFSVTVRTKFPFRFNGQVYDRVNVSSNGFMRMGNNPCNNGLGSWENTTTSSGRAMMSADNRNSIVGFNVDLISVTTSGNNVTIDWNLTAPIRYVAFQWSHYRRYFSQSANDDINFQIYLFENGAIEYHYGQIVGAPGSNDVQIGLHGSDESARQIVAVTNSWERPQLNNVAATFLPLNPTNNPAANTVWRFVPPPPTAIDMGIQSLALNSGRYRGCPLGTQEPVYVTVNNIGTNAQSSAVVGYIVDNNTPVEQTVTFSPPLATGQTKLVTFSGAQGIDLSQPVNHRVRAYLRLTGDTVRRNDSARTTTSAAGAARLASGIAPATDIGQAYQNGWRMASGNPIAQDTSRNWKISFPFPSETIGGYVNANANNSSDWFLLTGVQTGGTLSVRFQLGITDQNSIAPVADIGQDSLKVMITSTCITGWRQVGVFTQADLASGRINNSLQTFSYNLSSADEVISVGFQLKAGSTRSAAYAFHLDNIQFVSGADAQAVSLLGFNPSSATLVTYCPTDRFPLRFVVQNNSQNRIDSIRIGYAYNGAHPEDAMYALSNGSVRGIPTGGRDTVLVSTPQTGAPVRGPVRLSVYTMLTGETSSSRLNDTVSISFVIGTPQPMPSAVYPYYSRMVSRGWITARNAYGLGDNQTGWAQGYNFANRGDTTAAVTFLATATSRKRDWLITPDFTHSGGEKRLTFYAAIGQAFNNSLVTNIGDDSLKIFGRENCGPWRLLSSITQADVVGGLDTNLRRYDIVLPLAATPGEVQFAFEATDNGTGANSVYRIHINKVFVDNNPVATKPLASGSLKLYPNPTTGILHLEAAEGIQLREAVVMDLQGRPVLKATPTEATTLMDLSGLPKGFYMVRCQDVTGKSSVQKVLLQ